MKKRIIRCSMILIIGIIGAFLLGGKKEKKEEIKKEIVINIIENQKALYKSSVPKLEQEYTLLKKEKVDKKEDEVIVKEISNNEEIILVEDISNNEVVEKDNLIESGDDLEGTLKTSDSNPLSEEENNKDDIENEVPIEENVEIMQENDKSNEDDNKIEDILEETKKDVDDVSNVKNGFYEEDGANYYYENDIKITGLKNIDGVNHYFSSTGKHLGTNKIKVIDVSYYQKDINWDTFAKESDCYGVILRLGYYETLDKKFERNLSELKRLNIPYGIYLFSYSTTMSGAKKEADFTNNMISKYDINPSLGIYYDIESWSTKTSSSNGISKNMYDNIIQYYINSVSNYTNYKYKVKVYSGRWYAMNRLGGISKKYVDWVAEYNSTCKYDATYFMWQYTSKGSVPGINGNVDISYIM